MTIIPINVGDVAAALADQIESDPSVAALDLTTVARSEPLNEDPGLDYWACIYRARVSFPVRTLGAGSGFRRQEMHFVVAMQASDLTSGAQCEERLDALVKAVVGAILSDPTLKGTVYTLSEQMELSYADYQMVNDQYMQTAFLEFAAIGQVSIGG